MKPQPVPAPVQCYWVLPGRLLAGEYPAHVHAEDATGRLNALLDAGIDTFMDLTQADELASYTSLLDDLAGRKGIRVQHERFPILDFGLPSSKDMRSILDRIDTALADQHNIYLHCWGGVGRTGLTVGCYLVRHRMTGAQALEQISEWWQAIPKRQHHPHSPETPEQMQFVLNWHETAEANN